jgi:hypothetical protein
MHQAKDVSCVTSSMILIIPVFGHSASKFFKGGKGRQETPSVPSAG